MRQTETVAERQARQEMEELTRRAREYADEVARAVPPADCPCEGCEFGCTGRCYC